MLPINTLITLVYPREVGKADRALATCLTSVSLPRSRTRMRGFFRSRVVKTPEQIGAEILDRLARPAESNNAASSALLSSHEYRRQTERRRMIGPTLDRPERPRAVGRYGRRASRPVAGAFVPY